MGDALLAFLEDTHHKEERFRIFQEFSIQLHDKPQLISALTLAKCKHQYVSVAAGEDVDVLYLRGQSFFAMIESCPSHDVFGMDQDDCSILWEIITLLNGKKLDCLEVQSLLATTQTEIASVTMHSVEMASTLHTL